MFHGFEFEKVCKTNQNLLFIMKNTQTNQVEKGDAILFATGKNITLFLISQTVKLLSMYSIEIT